MTKQPLFSIWLRHAAKTFGLSTRALSVGSELALETNPREHSGEFRAWLKQETLADWTGMSVRSVGRAIAELRDKGVIEVRIPATGRPTNRVYVFTESAIHQLETKANRKAVGYAGFE